MHIEVRKHPRKNHPNKFIAEVWADDHRESWTLFNEPYPEEEYQKINQWCKETLGYPARIAYHIFEFKKEKDVTLFILRWK